MSIVENLGANTKLALHQGIFALRQKSPEILTGAGVVAVVGSGFLLVRATIRAVPVIDALRADIDVIKNGATADGDDYDEKERQKDLFHAYRKHGLDLAKIYLPAVALGAAGIGSFVGAGHIQKKRTMSVIAAYKSIETMFEEYRERVREEYGDEKEEDVYRGVAERDEEDPETGETRRIRTSDISGYARFFDDGSRYWNKTPEFNLLFLRSKQNYFTDYLRARGTLFLNDVYRELGIPESQAGAVVGWVLSPETDDFVDFGIYDQDNERARAFVNGDEAAIRLDFNVAGVIIHHLKK